MVAVGWALLAVVLPAGLPLGVVMLGLVLGGLSGLTAMGLVLIHRASRIINFAQAELGGLAASVAVVMVAGRHLPYLLALPLGLAVAVGTGALVDVAVVRRLFNAPRLLLTVATIGVAQVLGGTELEVPHLVARLSPLTTFRTPFRLNVRVGPIVFTGDHFVAVVAVVAATGGLWWFLARSETGSAIRASADSQERALLLGIPVRRLSTLTWAVAAGLSGLAAILSAPVLGPNVGAVAGPEALLAPLAAAVLGGMESLPVAVAASLGIGVAQQAVFWSYPRASTVDVALFVLVVVALLLRRRRAARVDGADLGGHVAIREVRPVAPALARLPEVRLVRASVACALALGAVLLPLSLSSSRLLLVSFMAIYAIVAVSLVVLSGWAGQISLGQFALAGIGAATTGSLLVHVGTDLFIALVDAAAVGALVAVAIGLPALRIRGLLLAATTLAFSVPVSSYVLNSAYFPSFTPASVPRPPLFGHLDLANSRTFYYLCLGALVGVLALARNFRRSRAGRAVVAVRDNERAAAGFAIRPTTAKLTAFAFSGALAGFAGGLYVLGVGGISFGSFPPIKSLEIFTMVVVGGLGSLSGAILGAVYVQGIEYFLHGGAQLLATGAGLLLLILVLPGGLGEVAYALRDRVLRVVARSRNIPDAFAEQQSSAPVDARPRVSDSDAGDLLVGRGLDAGYDARQVLFGVDASVAAGEVLAILGTNGAGKSTLLRVIAGVVPARAGRVTFDGLDITSLGIRERVARGVALAPGGRGVFASLTVAENLRVAAWTRRGEGATTEQATAKVLELFPVLRARLNQSAGLLSGGEQQMLTLAQALIGAPRLLLIDELSLGLAPDLVSRLLEVIRYINAAGTTIVLVEQSPEIAARIATRALFMERGQVRFSGPPRDLLGRGDLLRPVFLQPVAPSSGNGHGAARPSQEAAPRLEVTGLRKSFGGVHALAGVDLAVDGERVVGIIGANGAGKTTLFDICSGFVAADGGRVLLDGCDVSGLEPAARSALGLGRSFQDARLFPSMTVAEAVATALERHVEVREAVACTVNLPAARASERRVVRRAEELLGEMGLTRYRDFFVSELSTGTRRILDLTCALAHEPRVLLLDEPASGVARAEAEALAELLLEVRSWSGAALVVVEHDMGFVSSVADELVCLDLGAVIARGAPSAVLADPAVVRAYLGAAEEMVTTAEYARMTGKSVATVLRRIRSGDLDAVRNGRSYRIPIAT